MSDDSSSYFLSRRSRTDARRSRRRNNNSSSGGGVGDEADASKASHGHHHHHHHHRSNKTASSSVLHSLIGPLLNDVPSFFLCSVAAESCRRCLTEGSSVFGFSCRSGTAATATARARSTSCARPSSRPSGAVRASATCGCAICWRASCPIRPRRASAPSSTASTGSRPRFLLRLTRQPMRSMAVHGARVSSSETRFCTGKPCLDPLGTVKGWDLVLLMLIGSS